MSKLYKTLVYDRQVSLSVLDTKDLVQEAIRLHNLDDISARVLGELLTACTYMAGCLKSERGAISITVKSGDGSATASVSGDVSGHIRGYIEGAEKGLKGGTMTVIKEDGFFRPYVGACEMNTNNVSENLMQYFDKSEQVPTAVAIGVHVENGVCLTAGGVVMQLLPGTTEENMDRAENAMQNFVKITKVLSEEGADGILEKYFGLDLKDSGIYLYFPEYKCNCSRKKIEGVIAPIGKEELLNIVKQEGKVQVHCHYCNTDYDFSARDIEELFKN